MFLFKVSLEADSVWSKWSHKKVPPLYVVSETKDSAFRYVEKYLKDGLKVKNITKLASQMATYMYSGASK